MQNKFLNIIGIISILIAFYFAVFTKKEKKHNAGNFNLNALENAEQSVNAAVLNARKETSDLVSIQDKTYMNFVRPLMDIDAGLNEITSPIFHLNGVNNSDETKKIVDSILPVLSNYSSDMSRDKGVYNGM